MKPGEAIKIEQDALETTILEAITDFENRVGMHVDAVWVNTEMHEAESIRAFWLHKIEITYKSIGEVSV